MSVAATDTPLVPSVQQFLATDHTMLINGNWVTALSGQTFSTVNPATGETFCQIPEGQQGDINLAVQAARRAFDQGAWRKLTASERGKLIWKLADLMESRLEDFAQLESLDNGKPVAIARVADVPLAIDLFRYMAGWQRRLKATPFPFLFPMPLGLNFMPTHFVNRWGSLDKLSRGISPCSWRLGN